MFQLVRYFSITSLIMMVLITLPLVIAFPKLTSNIFFNAETQKNYELAQLVLNSFGQTYIESILRTETLENQERVVEGQIAHFDRQVKKKLRSSSVAKVKLFGATGTTVYSSHLVEIGGDDQESEGFQSAIQGEAHSTGIKQKQFHGISGTLENRYIFSTYVPVKTSETGKVIGVFELYSDVTPTYMLIRRADRALGISVLVLAVLIYLFLQLIVRRGEGVIARQYKELSTIQEQLSQQADELKRSNQELETFAYIASHDLQEPLRKIQAFGDRLSKKYREELGDNGLMYLDRMQDAAGRMKVLIQDLLKYSRVTSEGAPFVSVDLNQIVKDVVSDLEVPISETKATVTIDNLPKVKADPLQMRQLFQNLIGNALKFHKEDAFPGVRVSSAISDDSIVLTVLDNGVGFDARYAEKVFQIFQRIHSRGKFEGSGMGLAIVRKIVERHGGTITAESTEGEGATFVIKLPVHKELEAQAHENTRQTFILKPVKA